MVSLRALLIQKSIKHAFFVPVRHRQFESFVNSEEYQTLESVAVSSTTFESFVNSEEYQTV